MFLIKRPFFRRHSIRGRFQRYGKTNKKKKSSAKKPAARKARPARKETRQTAGIEKGRKADESRKTRALQNKKKRLSLRPSCWV